MTQTSEFFTQKHFLLKLIPDFSSWLKQKQLANRRYQLYMQEYKIIWMREEPQRMCAHANESLLEHAQIRNYKLTLFSLTTETRPEEVPEPELLQEPSSWIRRTALSWQCGRRESKRVWQRTWVQFVRRERSWWCTLRREHGSKRLQELRLTNEKAYQTSVDICRTANMRVKATLLT